jgi:hypothetical protein
MALITRPRILAYQLAVAPGATSTRFVPAEGKSWEVHSIIVSRAATVYRDFDPAGNNSWPVRVIAETTSTPDEFHGYKWELDERSGIAVKNDSTEAMDVVLVGVEIT